jgi:mannose-6-phosphate isomerase-like protein (cupin superfamily)
MKGVRRVVTGFDEERQAIFTSDGPAAMMKESEVLGAWAVDIWEMGTIPPELTDHGALTTGGGFPKTGSLVFRMIQLPPEGAYRKNPEEAERYMGGPVNPDSDDFGMHRSDTVDLIIMISGEVWAIMDSGEKTLLKPGDTLIQRGTVHTWRNLGAEPCVMAAVLVGTEPG